MSSDEFFQTTALAAELVEVPTAASSAASTPSLSHQPYPTQVSVPNSSNPLSSSAIKPSSRTKRKNPSEATPLQQLAETGADVEQKKPRRAAALSTSSACSGPSTSSTMISNPSSIAVTSYDLVNHEIIYIFSFSQLESAISHLSECGPAPRPFPFTTRVLCHQLIDY
jgi:Flp pilus assembly protein TadD